MLRKVKRKSKDILDYIGKDYYKCLYLYLDYEKYGISNDNIKFWIQTKENSITCIILKYYSGMHIYSKDNNLNIDEVIDLIKEEKPETIFSSYNLIEQVNKKINDYEISKGNIRELSNITYNNKDNVEKQLDPIDYKQLVKLITSDKIGEEYSEESLMHQFIERKQEGYGRNYIIKKDNKVIAHAGTGAENNNIAIINFVITDNSYRFKGYGKEVVCSLCKDLIDEGKKAYLINYTEESTAFYTKIGFKKVYELGKLAKK